MMNYDRGVGFGELTFDIDGETALQKYIADNCSESFYGNILVRV